jgi:hypothetical protein
MEEPDGPEADVRGDRRKLRQGEQLIAAGRSITASQIPQRAGHRPLERCPHIDLRLARWRVVMRRVMSIAALGRTSSQPVVVSTRM